jgi:hypothetical protein
MPLCREHHEATHTLVRDWVRRGVNPARWNLWTAARELREMGRRGWAG